MADQRQRAGAVCFLALVLIATGLMAQDDMLQDDIVQGGLYIHVIETAARGPIDDAREALTVDYFTADPERAAQLVGGHAVDDHVRIQVPAADTLSDDPPTAAHLEPSFLIDFDEPSVVALTETLRTDLELTEGTMPSIRALVDAIDRTIKHKDMSRGWDLPSRVAETGIGDCSEHAVLLAATARSFGLPARVVIGIALVWEEEVGGFGHAWTEIWDGEHWQIADATGIDQQATVRYLSNLRITSEGPGYSMGILDSMAAWPQRLEVSQAEPTVR